MCKCRCGCTIATRKYQDLCKWCEGVKIFGRIVIKHTGQ